MTTQTTIRIEEQSYKQVKTVLKRLGLTYSQAINIFNNMIVLNQGLPFRVNIPNVETLHAINEAKRLKGEFFDK